MPRRTRVIDPADPRLNIEIASVPEELKEKFAEKKYDEIEDTVMLRLESQPEDINYFVPVIRAFIKRKERDRAAAILQLIIDTLQDAKHNETKYILFMVVMKFWPTCELAVIALVDVLEKTYSHAKNFDELERHCEIKGSKDPVKALSLLETWVRFQIGQPVYMKTRGVGRISEVNLKLNTVRATFESTPEEVVSLRITEAQRLFEYLHKGHFFRDMLERPEEMQELAKRDPAGLLSSFFASIDRALLVSELKEMLAPLVPAKSWPTWWKKARGDRRVTVSTGSKPTISWSESAQEADSVLANQFAKAKPKARLEIAAQQAGRSAELDKILVQGLIDAANAGYIKQPGLALEIGLLLEKMDAVQAQRLEFPVGTALAGSNVVEIVSEIRDRALRKETVARLQRERDDWPHIYARYIIGEQDAAILAIILDALATHEGGEMQARVVRQALSNPGEAPKLFHWICREMERKSTFTEYIDWNLLRGLTASLTNEKLKGQKVALKDMFDAGGLVDKSLDTLSPDQARLFLDALERSSELEAHRRQRLRQLLLTKFAELREEQIDIIHTTKRALEKMRAELEDLVTVQIPRNADEIQRAREFGDLKENFEYHAARARQELLSSQAKTLHDQLTRARPLDPGKISSTSAEVGTRLMLKPQNDGEETIQLTILGPWDSNPTHNIISYTAKAATGILGKKRGDEVDYNEKEWVIENIEVWE
ncbi:MAG: hypothetical protein GF398_09770 [Chitinivibrionales bacterium]|nr:hypothetical protein [Chitinivibrionales bacterium]